MKLYEVCKSDLRKCKGNIKQVINQGNYIIRDDNFIKHAFNFGNGSIKHMNEYMKNNSVFCVWYDVETMKKINRL